MGKIPKKGKNTMNTIVKIYDPNIQGISMIYSFYMNMTKIENTERMYISLV